MSRGAVQLLWMLRSLTRERRVLCAVARKRSWPRSWTRGQWTPVSKVEIRSSANGCCMLMSSKESASAKTLEESGMCNVKWT